MFPERIDPADVPTGILALHLARYRFALPMCRRRDVLDAACGVGYGAQALAREAARVIAVDRSPEALHTGKRRFAAANLAYCRADCEALPLGDETIDVVCSFETIEHLSNPGAFLAEAVRILRPDGAFIVSTPHADRTTTKPQNPHHRQEWSPADFERLLRERFRHIEVYGQTRRESLVARVLKRADVFKLRARLLPLWLVRGVARGAGGAAMADLGLEHVMFVAGHLRGASELVAVGRGPKRGVR